MFYAVMQSGHMGIFVRARAKEKLGVNYGDDQLKGNGFVWLWV